MTETNSANTLFLTRLLNAKPDQVWDAWVDPIKVAAWWGPRGFSLTTKRKDVRTGGNWLYTMHGPDGTDYPNHTKFLEVHKLKRLVYDHGGFEDRPPLFRVSVEFTPVGVVTKMDMAITFATPQAKAEIVQHIKRVGGEATWDRLAEYLAKETLGKDIFVINRSFEASINQVFAHWTDPERVMRWLPPKGFSGTYLKADIRARGETFYSMSGNGLTMYGRAKYLTIEKPSLLIYTQVFADKDGETSRHPLAPVWPETMKTTVQFFAEAENRTRVCVVWEILGGATLEERAAFINERAGMTIGWTGSFDNLEQVLA